MGHKSLKVKSQNQQLSLPILKKKKVTLCVKREDLLHPVISGNKFRKLTYNVQEAKTKGFSSLLTFGGAYSNHIAATAFAGRMHKLKTIGVIRGDELASEWQVNPTLKMAKENGMIFKFISRTAYREKDTPEFLKGLEEEFGTCFVIPEGGTNALAVKGCEEILTPKDVIFDVVSCCVGTGGTLAGLSNTLATHQELIGFPALKGDFLKKDIRKFTHTKNWRLCTDYHFGGYAKVSKELIQFMNAFKKQTNILLDPIYTGKMAFGLLDMIANDLFEPNTKILMIHSGGLQGIQGMNTLLQRKNLPQINI